MADGFLLIDKQPGWTSHDVVASVRRLAGGVKIGHAGTLDPMATGLLVLGLGRATRLLRYLTELPKEYRAQAMFGVATDTLDAEGAVVWREPTRVTRDAIQAVLPRFVGRIAQVPPMVSAVQIEGRRLYRLAREGKDIERPARLVDVHELEVVGLVTGDYPVVTIRVVCGKGTFVRTLADDLAQALGTRAHLTELRRTRVGSFRADDGRRLEDLVDGEAVLRSLLTPEEGLRHLPAVEVAGAQADAARHGRQLPPQQSPGALRVVDGAGRLLAVYRQSDDALVPEVVLG